MLVKPPGCTKISNLRLFNTGFFVSNHLNTSKKVIQLQSKLSKTNNEGTGASVGFREMSVLWEMSEQRIWTYFCYSIRTLDAMFFINVVFTIATKNLALESNEVTIECYC